MPDLDTLGLICGLGAIAALLTLGALIWLGSRANRRH